ncbi:MAG: lipopolysaccharide biosynthesis protein [Acidobacteria bacterium]|nr:lipopolysaccharide biosynthesis protein [Acidobacteriota bacterium]
MFHRQLNTTDYLKILQRRWWLIALPGVLLATLAYVGSLFIPNTYTSQTLVLVEGQQVPDEIVRPIMTETLNMRLVTMQEQILSRTRLQPLIERFGLYRNQVGKMPMEDLVAQLRKDVKVTPIHTDTSNYRGLPGFYIAFTADSPRLAQQVCMEITSMFTSENLHIQEQTAQGTTDFLKSQLDDAKRGLDEQDARLAVFKKKYIGQLPEQAQNNLAMLGSLNTQLNAVTANLSRAREDKTYVDSLLANTQAAWEAQQQNAANGGASPQTIDQQLTALQTQLTQLKARYTDDFPDVVKLKNEIARLSKQEQDSEAATPATTTTAEHKSTLEPQQVQALKAQRHVIDQNIAELAQEQGRLQKGIHDYESRVQLTPSVEEEFKQLTRDYETALKFYNDLLAQKTRAEMATDLQRRQEGEQFRIMDPANLPEKPTYPNRPLIAAGGGLGGLVLGLAVTFLLELSDKSLKSESDVKMCLQMPILALIPWSSTEEARHGWRLLKNRSHSAAPGAVRA